MRSSLWRCSAISVSSWPPRSVTAASRPPRSCSRRFRSRSFFSISSTRRPNAPSFSWNRRSAFRSSLRDVGMAAALGVVNVLVILLAVLLYLRTVSWREADA